MGIVTVARSAGRNRPLHRSAKDGSPTTISSQRLPSISADSDTPRDAHAASRRRVYCEGTR